MEIRLYPSQIRGQVQAPPSKSAAHRALICAALSPGESRVEGILPSADMEATIRGLTALGAQIRLEGPVAHIRGLGGLPAPLPRQADCGESGSTLRFLLPLFALTGAESRLTGQGRLPQRPLGPYAQLFQERGLPFAQDGAGVSFRGPLQAGEFTLDGDVSSQFISGLLFALPLLPGDSCIHIRPPFESRSYVGLTLDAMAAYGVKASFVTDYTLAIPGGQSYRAPSGPYVVEGDASQAAFFCTLGACLGGISLTGLSPDTAQGDRVILDILSRCGAAFAYENGAYRFQAAPLQGVAADLGDCPDLGPILMVLGLFCKGETRLYNCGRLRLKESDRGAVMAEELRKLGGQVFLEGDTIRIRESCLHAGKPLHSHGDHRVAMALAIAGLCARIPITLQDAQAVNKSYPAFWEDLESLGARLERSYA